MKPYIKVVDKSGKVTFMHSDNDNSCSCIIYGDSVKNFKVGVTDREKREKEFSFDCEQVGEIIARAISPKTVDFVRELFGEEDLCEIIETREVYFGYAGFDETMISSIEKGEYGKEENNFFFRLEEQSGGEWSLSFVFFGNEAVESDLVEWPEFSR
ncbi:MAG: hypothetical protein WC827_00135 [Candidatus Paceibacterota bacterium]|jgi:hypothetical protein